MKAWMKSKCFLLVLLALVTGLLLTACREQSNGDLLPDASSADETPSDEGSTSAKPEAENTVLSLITNGETYYTLVYDDSDSCIAEQVKAFCDKLKTKYGVTLTAVPVRNAEDDYGREIVVGNVRESAEPVLERLRATNDFAMCVSDNDWVLCATSSRLYQYLFLTVERRILPKMEQGNLSIESKNDFVYHDSALRNESYIEFALSSRSVSASFLAEIFEAHTFLASDGTCLPYRLYVPYDYDASRNYPVLLFLHGAGERGADNLKQLNLMLPDLFRNRSGTPLTDAIIVAPQCPNEPERWVDTSWLDGNYSTDQVKISNELSAVMELLGKISSEYSVDADRRYVMGLSMGGFGTWDLLMRYPDYFAAGIPICGGADPARAAQLACMPVWTFHGSADAVVPVSGTREMVAALKAAGSTCIRYEEFEGEGHVIWGTVAARKDVINWLFEQKLSDRA